MKTIPILAAAISSFAAAAPADVPCTQTDSFAVQMFSVLATAQQGNIVFSPASLEGALHLLQQGARGSTAAELNALPMGKRGIATSIQPIEANALFIDDRLQPSHKISVNEILYAPFGDDNEKAAAIINAWASKNTKGLITHILSKEDLSPNTRLVAANAIYLKAKWSYPFDPDSTVKNTRFTLADGTTTKVDLMFQREHLRYAEGDDWQAVMLFYEAQPGHKKDVAWVGFIGILPKGDAREFARTLTPHKYQAIRSALAQGYPQDTVVYLPRFDMDSGVFSLKPALEACGVSISFTPHADYKGFADTELMLSDVLQRCRAKVDEDGTEAAAVTMAIAVDGCCAPQERPKPKRICFDRPFIWVITDLNSAAAPYFMGLMEKP
ncbi:MAG: hypothetical protein IJA63_09855 [Akkermansia sp.]|nr:hypothetical protein [Akkermansia sp.]